MTAAMDEPVGVRVVAKVLRVSQSWVRRHARMLGGSKVNGMWQFDRVTAVTWGGRLIDGSNMDRTIISVCGRCGAEQVTRRGRLGYSYINGDHLPGMCEGEGR